MGQASRRKRERREAARQQPFMRLDLGSALNVVCAATLSPTASHRLPTLTSAFLALLSRPRNGEVEATHDHLEEILEGGVGAAQARGRTLASVEDFVPLDVRAEVRTRFRGELHRLVPGGWEAPVSVIEDAAVASQAFDPFLVPEFGFGIADLTELALRYGDQLIDSLRTVWPREATAEVRGDTSISAAEVSERVRCRGLEEVAGTCSYPDRALEALSWATRNMTEVQERFDQSGNSLGPVLACRWRRNLVAVPGGLLLDAVHEGVAALRDSALADPAARARWQRVAQNYVLDRVAALGPIALDVDAGAGAVTALQYVDEDLFLAIDVVPLGLQQGGLTEAKGRLAAFSQGSVVSTGAGEQSLPASAEVARAVVLFGMGEVMDFTAVDEVHVPVVEAQVLRWMVATSQRPDDVPRFLLDTAEEEGRQFSFGPFDEWEVWRSGDMGVQDIGIMPTFTVVESHGEAAEWERHADLAELERALLDAGLPALVTWTQVRGELDAPSSVLLEDFARRLTVRMSRLADGLIIAVADVGVSSGLVPPSRVARALLWRLRHMGFVPGLLAPDVRCLRLSVGSSSEPIVGGATAERVDGAIVVTYNDPDPDRGDPAAQLESALGRALGDLLPAGSQSEFLAAWQMAPAGLAIDVTSVPQTVADPGAFVPPHPAIVSHERRWLARHLANAEVPPGMRSGADASDLEARIYSLLDGRLHSLLRGVDGDIGLRQAMNDLERLHAARSRHDGDVNRRIRLHTDADTDIDLQAIIDERDELVRQVRSVALVVESLVQKRPAGDSPLAGRIKWQAYALAQLMVESGLRRDALDYGLANTAIEITDVFEVRLHTGTSDFDNETFVRTRTAASLPQTTRTLSGGDDPDPAASATQWHQNLETELIRTAGFGVAHVAAVLDTIIAWETVSEEALVTSAPGDAIVDAALAVTDLDVTGIKAALAQLSLRSDDLTGPIEHWKLDQRRHRLATRPIVEDPGRGFLVCPYSAAYARDIIGGHLSDLRSPWADAVPPAMATSLARLRESRNKEFEDQVNASLREVPTFVVRANVQKGTRLGSWDTEREIDALCLDTERRRLWVIEAKDPAADFVARQIGRSIERFYGEKGHIPKLIGSLERAQDAVTSVVADLSGVESGTEDWTVLGAIVTRRVEAAAFHGTPTVWFATLDTVLQTLDTDDLPEANYGILRRLALVSNRHELDPASSSEGPLLA